MKHLIAFATLLTLPFSAMAADSLYDIPIKSLAGEDGSLKPYEGKVMLFINVASKCGYTNQYAGLQKLHEEFQEAGLVVIGVPSNDFGGQEPGSAEEIATFCEQNYGVTFPMTEKISISGEDQHPIYAKLTEGGKQVGWNFEKILVGKDGAVLQHFGSGTGPEDAELRDAVTAALGK